MVVISCILEFSGLKGQTYTVISCPSLAEGGGEPSHACSGLGGVFVPEYGVCVCVFLGATVFPISFNPPTSVALTSGLQLQKGQRKKGKAKKRKKTKNTDEPVITRR